jgi:hypothetical protein
MFRFLTALTLVTLTARITVGYVGQITVLDRNIPQVW